MYYTSILFHSRLWWLGFWIAGHPKIPWSVAIPAGLGFRRSKDMKAPFFWVAKSWCVFHQTTIFGCSIFGEWDYDILWPSSCMVKAVIFHYLLFLSVPFDSCIAFGFVHRWFVCFCGCVPVMHDFSCCGNIGPWYFLISWDGMRWMIIYPKVSGFDSRKCSTVGCKGIAIPNISNDVATML